jgi:hypothetical protein
MFLSEKDIGKNLEKVRVHFKDSYEDFAARVGLTANTLKMYIRVNGGKKPSSKVTEIIGLGVSGNWYLTGIGEMFNKKGDPEHDAYAEIGRKAMELKDMLDKMACREETKESVKKAGSFSGDHESSSSEFSEPRPVIGEPLHRSGPPPKFTGEEMKELFGRNRQKPMEET